MTFDANAIIAEATAAEAAATEAAKAPQGADQADPSNPTAKPPADNSQDLAGKPDSELTPEQLAKREENRQSHRNSKLAKMRRENRELREALAKGQQPQAQPAQVPQNTQPANDGRPVKPKEADFEGKTWGDYEDALDKYYEDLTEWKVEQRLAKEPKQAPQQQQNQPKQLEPAVAQRIEAISQKEAEFAQANPDYVTLYAKHADFLNDGNLPLPIAQALLTAEDANLALYALMKEGRLEELEDMEPMEIFREVAKAEVRGAGYVAANAGAGNAQPAENTVTNAPRPMRAARGNANPEKDLYSKDVGELMEQFNNRR